MTEERREYQRRYREAHREKARESAARYRALHKEDIKERDRQYYNAHKNDPEFMERRRAAFRKYRRLHPNNSPEALLEWKTRRKKYTKDLSPEEKREYNHQRYLRRREKALEYSRTHPKKKKQDNEQ